MYKISKKIIIPVGADTLYINSNNECLRLAHFSISKTTIRRWEFSTSFDRKWFTDVKYIRIISVGALIREESIKMCAADPRAPAEK